MTYIFTKDTKEIKHSRCCCGKSSDIAWHYRPKTEKEIEKETVQKLSKSEKVSYKQIPGFVNLVGWCCFEHPPESLSQQIMRYHD